MKKRTLTLCLCTLTLTTAILTGCQLSTPTETQQSDTQQINQNIEFKEDKDVIQLDDNTNVSEQQQMIIPNTEKTQKIEKNMIINGNRELSNNHFLVDTVEIKNDGVYVESHTV